jgi:hypothetical protein
MASDDETIRLILQVTGEAQARNLRGEIEKTEKELIKAAQALGTWDAAVLRNDPAVAAHTQKLAGLNAQLKTVEKSMTSAGGAGKHLGLGFLELSRGIEDFAVAGLRGALNNIPQIITMFGGPAGLAAAVSATAVAALLAEGPLGRLLDSLKPRIVSQFSSEVERLNDKIKELSDKPIKTGADTRALDAMQAKLNSLIRAKQRLDALMGAQTEAEKASGQAVEKAIIETPGGQQVLEQAQRAFIEQQAAQAERGGAPALIRAEIPKLEAKLAAVKAERPASEEEAQAQLVRQQDLERQIADANARLVGAREAARADAAKEFAQLTEAAIGGKGKAQTDAQRQLAGLAGAQGGKALAEAIGESSPEALQRRAELDAEAEAEADRAVESGKEATQARRNRDRRAEKAKHEADRQLREEQQEAERTRRLREQAEGEITRRGEDLLGNTVQQFLVARAVAGQAPDAARAEAQQRTAVELQRRGIAHGPAEAAAVAAKIVESVARQEQDKIDKAALENNTRGLNALEEALVRAEQRGLNIRLN